MKFFPAEGVRELQALALGHWQVVCEVPTELLSAALRKPRKEPPPC